MNPIQYARLVSTIRFEVAFWALLVVASIYFSKSSALGFIPLFVALLFWVAGVFIDSKYKKLEEEYKK